MVIVDTNIFMNEDSVRDVFEEFDNIAIPVEVLSELDNLKTKEGRRGYQARNGIRAIKANMDKIKFLSEDLGEGVNRLNMLVDDIIIKRCLIHKNATLITNDIGMEIKAKSQGIRTTNFYGREIERKESLYKVTMTEQEFTEFQKNFGHKKLAHIPIGQFVEISNSSGAQLGLFRFLGKEMWDTVEEKQEIKNYLYNVNARDNHQRCAVRSLDEDEFTVITGPAGTGKTLFALAESLKRMNKDGATIHIFVNPVKTRDSEALGFYPGSRDEKLLSNFIGGVLSSKFGDQVEVERLMNLGGIKIYPFSDIRGIEIGAGDVMYITEAQNLSIDLIKLAIQRCADGSKLIIEGDAETQVDKYQFEGENNGLQRVIDVFTGTDCCEFGYIHLPNVYRSKMANKAEEL